MQQSKDTALVVGNLDKDFSLEHERKTSLKERVLSLKGTQYEKLHVLKNINFEVKKGEFFGIVGRNGSGKSTLLKIIGGIYQPTRGHVTVSGTLTPFIELGIGFNPELTGRENVYLNGAILGLNRKEVEAKYDEIVEFSELKKFMDQKLKNYSSGMQVRLAFSIAIQAHNDILLIDEVLAVGDASFQRKCFETFKGIKQSGKTVIFVSHDMNAIKEYCERAVLIENGEIVSHGPSEKVANDYIELFNADAKKHSLNRSFNRWGDLNMTIGDVKVSVNQKSISVSFMASAHQNIDNPIFGLIVRDIDNHHLIDTNTKWKKINTGVLKENNKTKVEWSIPNILKSGIYSITVAAAHKDGLGFYDWQDNVKSFDIVKAEETAGLLLLDHEIIIKRSRG